MEAHASAVPLREALVFLAVAGLLVPLLQRLRVNPVFGFLAAGALLGPSGLGGMADRVPAWLAHAGLGDREAVDLPAQLGLLFLMFSVGLELSFERLRTLARWVFGAGGAQLVATAAAIGAIVALTRDVPVPAAAVVGCVLAFSSTAVALQLLAERDRLATPLGRASFAVLLMQDLAVVPLLLATTVIGSGGDGTALALGLGWALAKGAAAIALILGLGRRLLRPAFARLILPGRPETFVALTLLVSLGTAAATASIGMSPALGALLAGLLLAETEFRHEIEATLEPFKALLMGLFFLSVGMGLDLRALIGAPWGVAVSVAALFALKAAVLAPILRAGGLPWSQALEGGLLLGQGGEFGFVMLGVAVGAGVVDGPLERDVALVIGASLFATPLAAALGRRLGARLERRTRSADDAARDEARGDRDAVDAVERAVAARDATPEGLAESAAGPPLAGRVVLAGYGRVGRVVGELLDRRRVDWMALESNPRAIVGDHEAGRPVAYGDVTRPELMRRLGVAHAAALVVTLPRLSTAIAAIEVARREAPALRILARARDEREARQLRQAGADAAIPETIECALRLAEGALGALGVAPDEVDRIIEHERERRIGPLPGR